VWSCVRAYIAVEVKDKKGKTRLKQRKPSRSFLRNFARVLRGLFYTTPSSAIETIVSSDGTTHSFPKLYSETNDLARTYAYEGEDGYGVLVGNGTTQVSFDDYILASKIPHGESAGQLYYYKSNVLRTEFDNYDIIAFTRNFENRSGENITVTEVGLALHYEHRIEGIHNVLIARDLLDPAITLAPLETLNARYEVEIRL